jgi:hypothetical protein
MAHNGADFTLVFRFLCDAAAGPESDTSARMLFTDSGAFAVKDASGSLSEVERRAYHAVRSGFPTSPSFLGRSLA